MLSLVIFDQPWLSNHRVEVCVPADVRALGAGVKQTVVLLRISAQNSQSFCGFINDKVRPILTAWYYAKYS